MPRLTIDLPKDVADRLADLASQRGVNPERVAREMVESHLAPTPNNALDFISIVRSGRADLSSHA